MEPLRASADALASHFLDLAEQDSEAYNQVLAAYRIPKEKEAQRREAIQAALKGATHVPMETLRSAARLVDLIDGAIRKGNPNCLTDAGVSALLIRAAAAGAAYNVRTNLSGIEDREFKSRLSAETSDLTGRIERGLEELVGIVETRLD
jgi:formiminotetrahydrofolate cyclodeaminase